VVGVVLEVCPFYFFFFFFLVVIRYFVQVLEKNPS